ncbi:ubiquitin-like modifier-activating enzyme Atg7p [[Candida] jaroonii]|uniref:Ubiquitin-like modifier-activating enzyme Atg7p n=1 Tax=[Candida] jaroonii TaxID=467808 RepID=A0ACA9YA59_9ASCO|nr:ubiquitin-like modifier-activating enzyme Atg7p [[Candida] jaroonii]
MSSMDVKFIPIKSFIDSNFFIRLSELKLDELKLDSKPIKIHGFLNDALKLNKFNNVPIMNLNYDSFKPETGDSESSGFNNIMEGTLYNFNTIEEFKNLDKQKILGEWGEEIKDGFDKGKFNQFRMITFCDLKKYKFYYWVAYPTVYSKWEVTSVEDVEYEGDLTQQFQLDEKVYIDTCLEENQLSYQVINFLNHIATTKDELTKKEVSMKIYKNGQFKSYTFRSDVKTNFIGWERTNQGKLGPKLANLGTLIDPHQLANQAVDLNLKLMKWRIAPNLNLDVINHQKVLLLGAGTLGSYVSRCLMGWGVKNITFVDNGRISYSNPVRQSLYSFKDCFSDNGQGEIKAVRASESLKEIFPGVNSQGIEMEIPMIGHPMTNEAKVKEDYEKLDELFDAHDVIFLLMDSRESRWLPTLMGISKNKLVINAALGFDSYLVLRHGTKELDLGCYYCNDVVAPNDSLKDRTLDQMCTVTRPGGALMASSLAVELLVSVLQHTKGKNVDIDTSTLGEIPHQIRGFLNNFQQMKLSTPKYQYCSACSTKVVEKYEQDSWEFIKSCLNDTKYLEDVCGLTEVQKEAERVSEQLMESLELDDDDWMD